MTMLKEGGKAQVALVMVQWLMLTLGLGAVVLHSESSLATIISPRIDSSFMFAGAFLAAGLLGITVESPKTLVVLTFALCLGASLIYAGLLLAPTWNGTIPRSRWLDDFLTVHVFLLTLMMLVPAAVGALAGSMLSSNLEQPAESAGPAESSNGKPWWENPSARNH